MAAGEVERELARAAELLAVIDFASWPLLATGLCNLTPYVVDFRRDRLEDAQAWLASHGHDGDSPLGTSVSNVRRVLEDLLLAFDHRIDVRHDVYWVLKWYQRAHGGSSSPVEIENFALHVLLIHHLTAELARALNLLLDRARGLDGSFGPGFGLAAIDTGASTNAIQAPRYSGAEAVELEPYPGLEAFPTVLSGRDLSALGFRESDVPRTPEDLRRWIDELLRRSGGASSGPPSAPSPAVLLQLAARDQERALAVEQLRGWSGAVAQSAVAVVAAALVLSVASDARSVFSFGPTLLGATLGGAALFALAAALRRPWRRDVRLAVSLLAGFTTGGALGHSFEPPDRRSLQAEVETQVTAAQRDGRYVVQRRSAQLHGESTSTILILRETSLRKRLGIELTGQRSDELRIIDDAEGGATLRFRYAAQNPGEVQQQPDGDFPGMLLGVRSVTDVDADGRKEVLARIHRSGPMVLSGRVGRVAS